MAGSIASSWSRLVSDAQTSGEGLATYYLADTPLGTKLNLPLSEDPFLRFWSKLFHQQAILYDMPPYPIEQAGIVIVRILAFIFATAVYAYAAYHLLVPRVPANSPQAARSRPTRIAIAVPLMLTLFFWPAFAGQSGVMMFDFWRPALGFRSALLAWDIFSLRQVDEVHSWSFGRFVAHLWSFPVEESEIEAREKAEGYRRNPRLESLKVYPLVFIEASVVFFGLLYFLPTQADIETMPRLAYHLYSYLLGFDVLFSLAFFGDGLLNGMGLLLGVEMAPMFESPIHATSIQKFWSTWNKAITVVLHRVIFARAAGAAKKPSVRASTTTDTEADDASKLGSKENRLDVTPAESVQPEKTHLSSTRPFYKKAIAAFAAFFVSGIFHEHITYFTFGTATLENLAFFALNGAVA